MVTTAIHAAVWSSEARPETFARVLASAAAAGYDLVALPLRNPTDLDVEGLASTISASGIGVIGTAGMPPGGDIGSQDAEVRQQGYDHLARVIGVARDIGIGQINGVIYGPLGRPAAPASENVFRRSAESLARLADTAADAGIVLCAEVVNRYETSLLNTVQQGLDYLALAGHPNLKLHLDTYHMSIEERDAPAAARAALHRLGYFELNQSHRGRLDEGSLDLAAMTNPLAEAGYDGIVGVEAFARSRLASNHANALAIWRDHFDDADNLARGAMSLIRRLFPDISRSAAFDGAHNQGVRP